jgi:hypothetical protein
MCLMMITAGGAGNGSALLAPSQPAREEGTGAASSTPSDAQSLEPSFFAGLVGVPQLVL